MMYRLHKSRVSFERFRRFPAHPRLNSNAGATNRGVVGERRAYTNIASNQPGLFAATQYFPRPYMPAEHCAFGTSNQILF